MRKIVVWCARLRPRTQLAGVLVVVAAAAASAWLALPSGGVAQDLLPSVSAPTDLLPLTLAGGQTPAPAPVQHNPEPPLDPTPRAVCGSGSNPLDGMQGRVPASAIDSPAAANGYSCNLTRVAHQGQTGGFKVLRYIDPQGHECGYYDTTLLFPVNAVRLNGSSLGVAVLDMTDPAHPLQTATLTSIPMLSPHESLSLNVRRGLLAAVSGNPATDPGLVSIYDLSADCRHPVLDSTALLAPFGHEGNFSPDGNTFWAAGTAVKSLTAIDVSDPTHPRPIWQGSEYSHGLTLSDDGNRAYVADPTNAQLLILDTSQIQARTPNPQVREISRLTWGPATIPQNAIPMTIHGHAYLLEFDEYAFRFGAPAPPDTVGAARIIDISDETHPRVVSNLRLEVDQPAGHHEASGDPGAISPVQGYAAHYCNVPREVDPEIAACSFISSGLRVFDIRDPLHPREIGYYIAPPRHAPENGEDGSNFAMSKPAFAPERREIWYTDGSSGFYVLRVPPALWPDPTGSAPSTGARGCPPPTGRLRGTRLGPVALGQTRALIRRELGRFSVQPGTRMDVFCLAGGAIRAGYPSGALLRRLGPAQRRRLANRVALVLSANRHYALDGLRPGARVGLLPRKLRGASSPFRVGRNRWYLLPGRAATGVLKVSGGVVREIGLASKVLTAGRARGRRLLTSF